MLKLGYSENFEKISQISQLLSNVKTVGKFFQIFVTLSEYLNFKSENFKCNNNATLYCFGLHFAVSCSDYALSGPYGHWSKAAEVLEPNLMVVNLVTMTVKHICQ